jgi:hypothetical protein
MRQPQISYQGYLEPVTRLINCPFGQLINTCHAVCMRIVMDMNSTNLFIVLQLSPTTVRSSWELEDLAVYIKF